MTFLVWQNHIPQHIAERWPHAALSLWQVQSLTKALRLLHQDFTVELRYLGECPDDLWLRQSEKESVFVRDVLLHLNGEAVVQARSICALDAYHWRDLLDCGTQPLGERLFDGSLPLTRSSFEFTQMDALSLASPFINVENLPVLARRSQFNWEGQSLDLIECFLPSLKKYFE